MNSRALLSILVFALANPVFALVGGQNAVHARAVHA